MAANSKQLLDYGRREQAVRCSIDAFVNNEGNISIFRVVLLLLTKSEMILNSNLKKWLSYDVLHDWSLWAAKQLLAGFMFRHWLHAWAQPVRGILP